MAFAEALKVNATLQSLNLGGACVGPAALRVEGGKALARVCAADMCVCVCVCVCACRVYPVRLVWWVCRYVMGVVEILACVCLCVNMLVR